MTAVHPRKRRPAAKEGIENPEAARQSCLECGRGWQLCHDTLILHADGHSECQDPQCVASAEVHDLTVPCDQLPGGCGCLPT